MLTRYYHFIRGRLFCVREATSFATKRLFGGRPYIHFWVLAKQHNTVPRAVGSDSGSMQMGC